jgi:dipeptidyl aminopeptidase/acylaminoacyl peptidase
MKNSLVGALLGAALCACACISGQAAEKPAAQKPPLTLDDFFNSVFIKALDLSPDGKSLIINTEKPDWEKQIFRDDLWIYREGGATPVLRQFTQSGHDEKPQWSPDGQWIAFISGREAPKEGPEDESDGSDDPAAQLYLAAADGGEAFPVTAGDEDVHAFAWAPDSKTLYFATRTPWTKQQKDDYKKLWKDTLQYRESERGDVIDQISAETAIQHRTNLGMQVSPDNETGRTPGATQISATPYRVREISVSADGRRLAFNTDSTSQREEDIDTYEIYTVDLVGKPPQKPVRITDNNGIEDEPRWAPDNRHIFFIVRGGSVEGAYADYQFRVYWVDADTKKLERWAADFTGNIDDYDVLPNGGIVAEGRIGTEVQLYSEQSPAAPFEKLPTVAGTYQTVAASLHSPRIAFIHSTLQQPTEVFLADNLDSAPNARQITSFNKLFTERTLPNGKPFRWTADDGTPVEGMLIYPPGKENQKHLRMFTFIHGGPEDSDGNHFEADWYQWAQLAATNGWLVFEPNYRGSVGYGDKFALQIVPKLVSKPGRDILEGIDALVKEGVADPDRLAIGGYSYGGYMTNWLITQRDFKAAVTGAGAVEHAANWGNDDTTFDDTYFLGGRPWEAQQNYNDEAALFRMNHVHTPTHVVAGGSDIRVAVSEDYLLEHALHSLGIPSTLLIFPHEGHTLAINPWHGKIKVREELKWLEKYCPAAQSEKSEK